MSDLEMGDREESARVSAGGSPLKRHRVAYDGEDSAIPVRPAVQGDAEELARICFTAFANFNSSVGQPAEFGEEGEKPVRELMDFVLGHKGFRSFVATDEAGSPIGSNHLDLRGDWAAIGPISVDPKCWERGVGRALMNAVLHAAEQEGWRCVCLGQVSANPKSYALYASMGFVPRETCVYLKGHAADSDVEKGHSIRRLMPSDIDACAALYKEAFGASRMAEISDCATAPMPNGWVSMAAGQVVAFTTGLNMEGFILARDRTTFKAFIVGISRLGLSGPEPEWHLPATGVYFDVLQWALTVAKLKVVRQTTLMVRGDGYTGVQRPASLETWPFVYCPSINY